MTFKVTTSMVTARTENDRIVYLYHGDIVPEGLSKKSVDHLKDLGFIAEAKVADKADVAHK